MNPLTDPLVEALNHLRLYGCAARIEEIRAEPWLERVMTIEREERTRRSLVHRSHLAGVGAFKPLCDFDWAWPKGIDRAQVEDLFSLRFIADGENVVLVGPNGVGKTMILRNLAHRALHDGRAVVVRTASDLLADLAKQESSVARARRLEAYVRPHPLHRRSRLSFLRCPPRRPPLRGRRSEAREEARDRAHDEQGLRRVAHDVSKRLLRRRSRRPAHQPRRHRSHRRRELSASRSRGATESARLLPQEPEGAACSLSVIGARRPTFASRVAGLRAAR
jgi:energy-coupling factor transporter ATP-binding protein EcfA2